MRNKKFKTTDTHEIAMGTWLNNRKTTYNNGLNNKPNKNGKVKKLDTGLIEAIEAKLRPFGFVWGKYEIH